MTWQPAPIVHPDAELWACQFFGERLAARAEDYAADVYVDVKVPNPRRPRMVIVRRDGGPVVNTLDTPRFGFRVFGDTDRNATDLALLVRALFLDAPRTEDGIAWTAVTSGPNAIEDPSSEFVRYLTAEAAIRGTDLTT